MPGGTPESEIKERASAAGVAAARLAREGHLVRLWSPPVAPGERKAVGLYRADTKDELDGFLVSLPLNGWMQISVTPHEPHPNDSTSPRPSGFRLPDRRLTPQIETASAESDWLNKGVFVSVGGRQAGGVVYEMHFVQ
jgi:muconolactone D-isomerase